MPPSPSDARQTDPQTIRFPFDANFNGLLESFLEEVEKVCRKVGIEIVNDAQRVFCLDVRIDGAESGSALH